MSIIQKGSNSILQFNEDITIQNVENFKDLVGKLIESDSTKLILNLEHVSYLNSAALGVIADSVLSARKQNKELVLATAQETVIEIFEIVKFKSFIKIFDTEAQAMEHFMSEQNGTSAF